MKKVLIQIFLTIFLSLLPTTAFAEEDTSGLSISIAPVSNIVSLSPSKSDEYSFSVTNESDITTTIEVYATPYSYTFSKSDNEYLLGFTQENSYTQITRWINFKNSDGKYTKKATFNLSAGESREIFYQINTPANLPAGGQYATIFARTLTNIVSDGINTEISPGLIIFGHAEGETDESAEIRDLTISKHLTKTGKSTNRKITRINASAKVKNTGNIDFPARGTLKVTNIFGVTYYETPNDKPSTFIIPRSELPITDEWKRTPFIGLFNVTWTVSALDQTEIITKTIFIPPSPIMAFILLLLTIFVIRVMLFIKKRKTRCLKTSV